MQLPQRSDIIVTLTTMDVALVCSVLFAFATLGVYVGSPPMNIRLPASAGLGLLSLMVASYCTYLFFHKPEHATPAPSSAQTNMIDIAATVLAFAVFGANCLMVVSPGKTGKLEN